MAARRPWSHISDATPCRQSSKLDRWGKILNNFPELFELRLSNLNGKAPKCVYKFSVQLNLVNYACIKVNPL